MSSFKHIAKFATQMVASIYVSKLTNKFVGQAFDRVFGSKAVSQGDSKKR